MRKDIDPNFRPHPLTGDVVVVKDKKAIHNALRNIVLTNFYERGFFVNFGTGVVGSLFELLTDIKINTLKRDITQAIENFEPQADLIAVDMYEPSPGMLNVNISYNFKNDTDPVVTTVVLRQAR